MQGPDISWLDQLKDYLGSLGGTGFGGSMGTQAPLPPTGAPPPGAPPTPPGQPAAPPAPPTTPTQPASAAQTTTAQGLQAAQPPAGQVALPSTSGGSNALAGLPPGLGQPGILDQPWLQAALAMYLGAIGAPRSKGLGGALSAGGLAGLQAYQTAKKDLYTPYLAYAGLQKDIAQTGELRAETAEKEAEAKAKAGITSTNQGFAQSIRKTYLSDPNLPVDEKNAWELTAQALEADTTAAWKPADIQTAHDSWMKNKEIAQNILASKATVKKTEAETKTEAERPAEVRAEAAAHQAAAAKDREALRQDKIYGPAMKQADIDEKNTQIAATAVKTAKGPEEQAAATQALVEKIKGDYKTTRSMGMRFFHSIYPWATWETDENTFVQTRLAELGITGSGATVRSLTPPVQLPIDKRTGKTAEGWRYDPRDPTGHTALDPDGTPHYAP